MQGREMWAAINRAAAVEALEGKKVASNNNIFSLEIPFPRTNVVIEWKFSILKTSAVDSAKRGSPKAKTDIEMQDYMPVNILSQPVKICRHLSDGK